MTPLALPLAALLLTFLPLLLAHDPTKLANIEFWGRYNKTTDAPVPIQPPSPTSTTSTTLPENFSPSSTATPTTASSTA